MAKTLIKTALIVFLVSLYSISFSLANFAGGSGTLEDPYQISNCSQLQNMKLNLFAHYALVNDIDCSETINWNSGLGFEPIGNQEDHFSGSFDGRNFTINGLYINRTNLNYIGLFGYVNSGEIKNVGLIKANLSGDESTGGLVGYENKSNIFNSYFNGSVKGSENVGGLVGFSEGGFIKNSYSSGMVQGKDYVGGLAGGKTRGNILDSNSEAQIIGREGVGGLVGNNFGVIISNSFHIKEGVYGENYTGGLVGFLKKGTIEKSYSSGIVQGKNYVGGLVGELGDGVIKNSYAKGSVSGNNNYTGGLVGKNLGEIINCSYTNGSVSGKTNVGGLAGYNEGIINNSYNLGIVSGTDYNIGGVIGFSEKGGVYFSYNNGNVIGAGTGSNVGGLVGKLDEGVIENSYGTGSVFGHKFIGGLVGYSINGTINNSYFVSNIVGNSNCGGIVGLNGGRVINSYSKGIVEADRYVGGLVGWNTGVVLKSYSESLVNSTCLSTNEGIAGGLVGSNIGTIDSSFSSGKVFGCKHVGGLIGYHRKTNISSGLINNSYSTGNVTRTKGNETSLGSFVGFSNNSIILKSYAIGSVSGNDGWNPTDKGFVGLIEGSLNFSDNFFDNQISGQITAIGAIGKTTSEMKTINTFSSAGWNIATTTNNLNNGYPYLAWQEGRNDFVWLIYFVPSTPLVAAAGAAGGGYCSTQWTCSEWSACENGVQTRTCSYPQNFCAPTTPKPEETRECTAETPETPVTPTPTEPATNPGNQAPAGGNLFTGLAIGAREFFSNPLNSIISIIVVLVVLVGAFWLVRKRRIKKQQLKKK